MFLKNWEMEAKIEILAKMDLFSKILSYFNSTLERNQSTTYIRNDLRHSLKQ